VVFFGWDPTLFWPEKRRKQSDKKLSDDKGMEKELALVFIETWSKQDDFLSYLLEKIKRNDLGSEADES